MTRLGNIRAYWLGIVVCLGGFLFGYDSGIVGGVLTLPSYYHDYHFKSGDSKVSSLVTSLQQLGAFVGCFLIWPITNRFGRRLPLMGCSVVFCVGAMIQTINTRSLPAFYVARVIAGLGLGGATVIIPMYSSEMAPKELRGQIGCFFQLFYTIGILISYWIDYGVKLHQPSVSRQWQIPIGLQIAFAGLLGLGVLTLRESVRWLTKNGQHERAWASLRWIRADDSPAVQAEMEEIRAGVELEARATEGFRLAELAQPPNFKLIALSAAVFTAQQSTGATAFAYYGPQYFKLVAGNDANRNLLLTGIFGAVKVVACATFVFLIVEHVGRRQALIFGAAGMAVCHIIAAAINKTHPPPANAGAVSHVNGPTIAVIAFVYLFVIIYNMSWGALPWPYVSEIFPTRIREPGIATGVAAQWLFAFVYTLATPYMVNNIRWGTFLVWGLFNVVIAAFSYLVLTETRGKSLEKINAMFAHDEDTLDKVVDDRLLHSAPLDRTPSPEALGKVPAGSTAQVVPGSV